VEAHTSRPLVSVVVVGDRVEEAESVDAELRRVLDALAQQEADLPFEVLVVTPRGERRLLPDGCERWGSPLPALRRVEADGATSYDLKNAGAREARAEIVALLDADCVPRPGWLAALWESMSAHPEADVVSGRTLYEGRGLLRRAAALLGRTYIERGRAAPCDLISNNNAAFRRKVLLEHPLGNALGPFGSAAHSDTILRAGGQLRFEPGMEVEHEFGGWPMLRSVARGHGFAMIRRRQRDPGIGRRWMVRLGHAAIPLTVAMCVADDWRRAIRYRRHYGVGWLELPFVLLLSVVLRAMEAPGMHRALRSGSADVEGYL
jgi:hypothetical protein